MSTQSPQGDSPIPREVTGITDTTHHIPLEIIGEIFAQFLPPIMDNAGRGELTKLCLVSKRWNDAARRSPTLWDNLRITLGYVASYPFQNVIEWLSRAGVAPKTLTIFVLPHYMQCEAPKQCRLTGSGLLRLLEEVPVLKQLRITSTSGRCYRNLLQSIKNRDFWDSLGSLSFAVTGEVPLDASNFLSLGMPQSLTAFELHLPGHLLTLLNRDYPTNLTSFQIPPKLLSSLTSFSFRCNWEASPIILTTLQHCINVTTLTLNLEDGRLQCDDSDPFITSLSPNGLLLPKLQTLRLRQWKPSEATNLFSLLKAPSIHHVDVSFERYEADFDHDQYLDCTYIKAYDEDPYFDCSRISDGDPVIYEVDESFGQALGVFMGRSGSSQPTLRSLRLHYAAIKTPALSRLLEPLDSLAHLTLDEFDLDDDCFKDSCVASVLPNLKVLELLRLPTEYSLEHADAFTGGEKVRSVTLKATHRDTELCCPLHSRRKPQEAQEDIDPSLTIPGSRKMGEFRMAPY
ncbi:hypothetical protein EST38_g1766 [Candolleomyces aberdarensis]|uniref:F-box domain-containing protein n=1 Tax=Candolleomyces aberdarensis TaxID=2316362 RepID=A0A4Q2DYK0_9AGAR|nr:hypothetical protein EST38_g1766 [Candolleomyces aberdarensis]